MDIGWNTGVAAQKVPLVPVAKLPGRVTPEQRYWKQFKVCIFEKEIFYYI